MLIPRIGAAVEGYAWRHCGDYRAWPGPNSNTFVAAEQTKLGAGHKERTAALHGQVIAAIGAEPAEALRSQMRSADAVIALEQLVSKLQGPAMSAAPAPTPAMPDIATRLYG